MKTASGPSNSGLTVLKHMKYEHLVAGITGGVTSTLILHPLDLIKIRFAGKVYASPYLCLEVVRSEIYC